MIRSTDRILSTHVGSLYRSPTLLEFYRRSIAGEPYDGAAFREQVRLETIGAVRRQSELGIDIPSDGEMSRFTFLRYFNERISGIELRPVARRTAPVSRDRSEFAEFYAQAAPHYWLPGEGRPTIPVCVGPIKYNPERAQSDIAVMKEALRSFAFPAAFFPAQVVPGRTVSPQFRITNEHYRSDEELDIAVADAIREEYKLLTDAGFIVQLDDPFLAEEWEVHEPALSLADYRRWVGRRVELLNYSLRDIPADMVRLHVCWGSWHGPHAHDLPFKSLVDLMLEVNTQAYSIEAANPQHEHEWEVWHETRLPDGKILIPGVVTHKSYVIEHPDLVAQRLVRFANLVGRENVIAAPDCGLGGRIHEQLGWAKLKAMVEGTRRASAQLWR
jgi:5-methyltetrahydropteroyltriglutamate--homocysteine methyltransferase